jgi:hypothetical protein
MLIIEDITPEAIPSQKYYMNMSDSQQLWKYGYLKFSM